jgi:hypothetical protein
MRLRVFYADKGDCLLLTTNDRKNILIDGGPKRATFERCTSPTLKKIAKPAANQKLDLVVVSHIDEDHIFGILGLVKAYFRWRKHDFDIHPDFGNQPDTPPPPFDRPPEIDEMWHNSWKQHLGDLASKVAAVVTHVAENLGNDVGHVLAPTDRTRAIEQVEMLAASITQASDLQDLVDTVPSPIARNDGFDDNLITLTEPPIARQLGSVELTLLGPTEERLEILREFWRTKLGLPPRPGGGLGAPGAGLGGADELDVAEAVDNHQAGLALVESIEIALRNGVIGDVSDVTEANRASIIVLAEEAQDGNGQRSALLTGDATHLEVIAGLTAAGRLEDGPFRCDVLKIQHHGSEHNLDEEFAAQVLAEHYVFCANGEHENPDPLIVSALINTRAQTAPDEPFTVWFNCSADDTDPAHQPAMRRALNAAVEAADEANTGNSKLVTIRVLKKGKTHFDICLCPPDIDCDCVSPTSATKRLTAPIPG